MKEGDEHWREGMAPTAGTRKAQGRERMPTAKVDAVLRGRTWRRPTVIDGGGHLPHHHRARPGGGGGRQPVAPGTLRRQPDPRTWTPLIPQLCFPYFLFSYVFFLKRIHLYYVI